MNKYLAYILLFLVFSCNEKVGKSTTSVSLETASYPVFDIKNDTFDFGKVQQNDIVNHDFTFTNTGSSPLIITSAKGSCGCTVADYPKNPILSGETATVTVIFDTANKAGYQTKTITLSLNTIEKTKTLKLVGTIN